MEARIRELEKGKGSEVIDVDPTAENAMVIFSAIEELRKDTEEGWKKLTVPLDQVIEANNASNVGLKKRDVQLTRREDIMDGWVCANRVKIDELRTKVALAILLHHRRRPLTDLTSLLLRSWRIIRRLFLRTCSCHPRLPLRKRPYPSRHLVLLLLVVK